MPADYINKLARMFQDIKVSNDLNQGFKKEYQDKGDIAGKLLFVIKCFLPLSQAYKLWVHHVAYTRVLWEKWQRSQLWLMWSPWRVAKYFGDLCLLHLWFIRKSVFLKIRYNTSKGPIFAGDCYLPHHLIADMNTRLELGDEVAQKEFLLLKIWWVAIVLW